MRAVLKMTRRSVKTFFGRYIALLLIVAVSVGFFAGLKVTTDSMLNAGGIYVREQNLYDFRLISTLGFTEEDLEAFSDLEMTETVQGAKSFDALVEYGEEEGNSEPFTLMSVTEDIDLPSLKSGRMPGEKNECLADYDIYDESDIGKVIHLSDENARNVKTNIDGTEFTIVGLAESPLYMGTGRGTTNIGNGSVFGFLYIPEDAFKTDVYTEIDLKIKGSGDFEIYSDEYDDLIRGYKPEIKKLLEDRAEERYDSLIEETGMSDMIAIFMGFNTVEEMLAWQYDLKEPETFVLTRNENAGYASFENDTSIIGGIANIFPIFFIVIALLVCSTTMTRMVDEERTQIGVLKAIGFSNGKIIMKYLLYAGSATLIGWAVGYFSCTWALPKIFWFAYSTIYNFSSIPYLMSGELAVFTLLASLAAILGASYISCFRELLSAPAELIRPKAAKNGKRILLERITPLWRRLPFLSKIVLRNMFRYKRRLFMMLIGIGCCAGLVVTGFGVRDSMIDISGMQYEDIQKYDIEAAFEEGSEEIEDTLNSTPEITDYVLVSSHMVDLHGSDNMNSVTLMSFRENEEVTAVWNFMEDGETLPIPEEGEALIGRKIAEKLKLSEGDSFEIQNSDLDTLEVTVSGIFDNYIYNYVIINDETYSGSFGKWKANTALINAEGDSREVSEKLTDHDEITSVTRLSETRETVDNVFSCLDYIIWLVVGFSGALAFIVIFNLTNINLGERSREIATVEVLGFYPKETERYVLRENIVLSVIAGLIGLPLGAMFHRLVMSMVVVDYFEFDTHIEPVSYVLALICTTAFAVIVNIFMKRQVGKIKMAESLKAVE